MGMFMYKKSCIWNSAKGLGQTPRQRRRRRKPAITRTSHRWKLQGAIRQPQRSQHWLQQLAPYCRHCKWRKTRRSEWYGRSMGMDQLYTWETWWIWAYETLPRVHRRLLRRKTQYRFGRIMGYSSSSRWSEDLVRFILWDNSTGMWWLTWDSVNWYQRNYPYTWAGARLVRDL